MTTRIIIDFDNTMGVPTCDIDDGLALLYLLGLEDAQVEGICTTYGNNELDVVHANTERLLAEWGLSIPLHRGGEHPGDTDSPAARFIAQSCAEAPGEIALLATGSTTNLLGACASNPRALDNAASITMMGGVTQSLTIGGKIMDELNLSCDPDATLAALGATCPVTIATAQNCLPAYFTREDIAGAFGEGSWMQRTCAPWLDCMGAAYGSDGFVCWDVVAAAQLMRPELFESHEVPVTLYRRFIAAGYLEHAAPGAPQAVVNMPTIRDADAFKKHALDTWRAGIARLGLE